MRRLLLAAAVAATAASFAPSASASIYCSDLGPVPGWGPVCTVKCVAGHDWLGADIKDLSSLVPVCPA